jgi:AcrR family transcriptional regulator
MTKARVGRPRSQKSRAAILTATEELLRKTGGAGLSIEAIARRAQVGKPTIYRWWPSLADIVLEVLLRQADETITVPDEQSLPDTLRHFLRRSMTVLTEGAGPHLRYLMAQAQLNDQLRSRFRDDFTARRRAVLAGIFRRAAERGQIGAGYDLELLVDLIFGAMWYRLLIGHAPLDESFADELTATALALAKAPAARRHDGSRHGQETS